MKFLGISLLFASAVMGSQIMFCSDRGCGTSCTYQSPAGNGACHQLGGISSAKTIQVDAGCSFTVYTDPNCSDFASSVGLGVCMAAPVLGSYSYDC